MVHRITAIGISAIAIVIGAAAMLPSGAVGSNSGPRELQPQAPGFGVVKDIDGHSYRTVKIGTRYWMADNLATTSYRDGTPIPHSTNTSVWTQGSVGAYCLPENDRRAPEGIYGLLYNYAAVNNSRGLCPEGWHVPTAAEWHALVDHLGGEATAGGRMKDVDSGLWRVPVAGASNSSGFSALPAGGRGRLGDASDAGFFATWWSATSHDSTDAWHWGLSPDRNAVRFNPGHKFSGFSVRCIQG